VLKAGRIRNKRMTELMSVFEASDLDCESGLFILADNLYEQISGQTPLDRDRNSDLLRKWEISSDGRAAVIQPLMVRLATDLESL